MTGTYSQNIYINLDLNKNELRNLVIGSASYLSSNRPIANGINDKGLLYYDQSLNHIMIWNGSYWKFAQHLDDRDYNSTDTVLAENIWTQTSLILRTASTWEQATMSSVVTFSYVTTSHVSGTYYFIDHTQDLKNLIPIQYGVVYTPNVKDVNNAIISPTEYKIEGNRILFQKGFTNQTNINGYTPPYVITATQTPSVEFLKYSGSKGDFTFGSGGTLNIVQIPSIFTASPPYELRPLPPSINPTTINPSNSYLSINGVMVFDWSLSASHGTYSGPFILISTASIGYGIDETDNVSIITN